MKKLSVVVLLFLALVALGCDAIEDAIEENMDPASTETVCGRYCHVCDTCKEGAESTLQQAVAAACEVSGKTVLCEETCDKGSDAAGGVADALNVKANCTTVESEMPEGENLMSMLEETYTCDDFFIAVQSGRGPENFCFQFCKKCVECGSAQGAGAVASKCSEQNGMICAAACEQIEGTIKSISETMESNDMPSILEMNCDDLESNFDGVMP